MTLYRWVLFSSLMPWKRWKKGYAPQLNPTTGVHVYPVRLALSALIIKLLFGFADKAPAQLHAAES